MKKLPGRAARAAETFARYVALVAALVTYLFAPLSGRLPLGAATLAAGAVAYLGVRLLTGRLAAWLGRKPAAKPAR